jgi:hypothetical protein
MREPHERLDAREAAEVLEDGREADVILQTHIEGGTLQPLGFEDWLKDKAEQVVTEKADAPKPDDAGKGQTEADEGIAPPARVAK